MRILEGGFPVVEFCDDGADSPVLNFWMIATNHPNKIDPLWYYNKDQKPVRYPLGKTSLENNPRCFSRDQLFMLIASEYFFHGKSPWKPKWFAPNNLSDTGKWKFPDPMFLPHQLNHQRMCYGKSWTKSGFEWLERDIEYNAKHTPLRESNQLLAMCLVANSVTVAEWLKLYCDKTHQWREALKLYWCDDRLGQYNRGEPELYESIVKYIENYL